MHPSVSFLDNKADPEEPLKFRRELSPPIHSDCWLLLMSFCLLYIFLGLFFSSGSAWALGDGEWFRLVANKRTEEKEEFQPGRTPVIALMCFRLITS
jgi:hypothetical protein